MIEHLGHRIMLATTWTPTALALAIVGLKGRREQR